MSLSLIHIYKWDQGITSIAKNYGATRFSIVTEALRSGRYRAKINYLGKCDPGSNESLYLAPGQYKTGLMSVSGGFYPHSRGSREIVIIVSDEISNQSRRAEKEHCMDNVRAFEITLKSADDTIRKVKSILEADNKGKVTYVTVSYTHLDVYKRQGFSDCFDWADIPEAGDAYPEHVVSIRVNMGQVAQVVCCFRGPGDVAVDCQDGNRCV